MRARRSCVWSSFTAVGARVKAVVVLEWRFSPSGYFEEPITISRDHYTMTIADGKVEAKIDSSVYDGNPSIRKMLHDSLNDRFLAVQLLTHRAYELSKSTLTRVHPDGRKHVLLEVETSYHAVSSDTLDIRVLDKDGNVVSDSRRDRIEKQMSVADLVETHRASDAVLAALLQSYGSAVRDPNNELVHLYEVREALSTRFGGEKAARAELGITRSRWSRLGELCNDEPLRQGRHRGKAAVSLRDATESELGEARAIARRMIETYLQYLKSSGQRPGA